MNFDTDTRTPITVTVTTSFDPSAATLSLELDGNGTLHACNWTGAATQSGQTWTRVAQTADTFVGPGADPTGATVIPLGHHTTKTHTTSGGNVYVEPSTPIDVR